MSAALAYPLYNDGEFCAANDNVAPSSTLRPRRFTVIDSLCRLRSLRVYDASGALTYIQKLAGGGEPEKEIDYIKAAGMTVVNINYGVRATYLHTDHLGSPLAGTSTAGNLLWSEQYSPFGEQLINPAANDDLTGFTGHIKDKATGLNYMQARYYDPVMGRFLSVDPQTMLSQNLDPRFFNRYAYTFNDPVNLTDPHGECPWCFVIAAIYIADKVYGAYDAAQTAKGVANGTIDPVDAAVEQGAGQLGGLIAGPVGRQVGKKIPNPFGKKGGPKHQQKTQDVVDDIESRGLVAETELKIDTPDGEKNHRFVDAVGRDPNTGEVVEMHQVGRTNPSRGDPVARERRAMDDIECATGCRPDFHDYNDPG